MKLRVLAFATAAEAIGADEIEIELPDGSGLPDLADRLQRDYPDHALLFGWNHAEEIMAKEQSFCDAGGEWIVYVPRVQVLK